MTPSASSVPGILWSPAVTIATPGAGVPYSSVTSTCAAMAGVSERIRFILGAVILPLHDPVLIAKQIAVTDLIYNGRMDGTNW